MNFALGVQHAQPLIGKIQIGCGVDIMKSKIFLFSMIIVVLLNGCATTQGKKASAQMNEFKRSIPTCSGAADCQAKWEAAQFWVVKNSPMKLQTATNVIIQTYNSPKNSRKLAATVTKEPLGNGKYRILINAWCDNWMWPCTPKKMDAQIHFNKYINQQ